MGLNFGLFLAQIGLTKPDNGFKVSKDILMLARDTNGQLCTNSSVPDVIAVETSAIVLQVAASQTHAGTYVINVPRDYDADTDYAKLRFLVESAGDTNTPTIDGAVYRKRPGAALSADLDPTISAAINNNTAKAGWVEIDMSSLDFNPGDTLTIVATTSAHTTDAANIYGVEFVYKSTLAYFVETER